METVSDDCGYCVLTIRSDRVLKLNVELIEECVIELNEPQHRHLYVAMLDFA